MKLDDVNNGNVNLDFNKPIYRLDYKTSNDDDTSRNNNGNSLILASYEVGGIIPTNIRLIFNNKPYIYEENYNEEDITSEFQNNQNSLYSTKIHSAESAIPQDFNLNEGYFFNQIQIPVLNKDDEYCSAHYMIQIICSDEFLYNSEYLNNNARINTQENIKLLNNDFQKSNNNRCCQKRITFSKSLPWVIFQNNKHFSIGESSIRKTRASIAVSEQYYHIPVPNLFLRQPISQIVKSTRKVFKKPCEIELLVNIEPINPYYIEQYLIKSRKIYSADPRLVTDLLLSNINNSLIDKCVETIIQVKMNRITDLINFRKKLRLNLKYIHNATKSRYLVNLLAKINFDPEKQSHNDLLNSLWECYFSKETDVKWELLGFQRCDQPYSDFRGVGILALICLLYFSLAHPFESKLIHRESSNSKYWYSFAVTGINITSWLRDWLNQRDHRIIPFFYKTENDVNMLFIFCELFSFIFLKFHSFWMERKPKNILEFPIIAQIFKQRIKFPLSDKMYHEDNKELLN
ncbi:MGC69076 protein [Cryptosporidium hominis TU502]|uniref:MGC69076 protein n=1 Tax=Cryptosporidium hominis (strain TU502) TaxID=353151 RepID=UPI0000452A79|nr:MGC69076 protein [Cryptosporidium hominis TU502]